MGGEEGRELMPEVVAEGEEGGDRKFARKVRFAKMEVALWSNNVLWFERLAFLRAVNDHLRGLSPQNSLRWSQLNSVNRLARQRNDQS